MYILYLAKLKERDVFWKEQARMVQGRLPKIAFSFNETKKVSPFAKFD